MAFVVDMEPMLSDVVLEIGDEPLEIDDGHGISLPCSAAHPPRGRFGEDPRWAGSSVVQCRGD